MSALNDFVVAAGSYFGLPEGRVAQGSTVETQDGEMELVLRIVLSTDDVVGIGKRVEAMAQLAQVGETQALAAAYAEVDEVERRATLREQWNSLPASQRSAFGSFHKYAARWNEAALAAQVPGVGVGEARKAAGLDLPAHVWVSANGLSEQQKAMAVGQDTTNGMYAVDPADLTEEQMEDWGPK